MTGIVHGATSDQIDLGGVIVPVRRIMTYDKYTVRRPVEGDLITFFVPLQSLEGAPIVQGAAIFKRVDQGVVLTAEQRIWGVDFVSTLLIIPRGSRVRLTYAVDETDTRTIETMYLGNDGHRLHFTAGSFNELDIAGLYAL